MKFNIITPSYNQIQWLGRCLASVADQSTGISPLLTGKDSAHQNNTVSVHHHVQDALSTDGTKRFMQEYAERIAGIIEKRDLTSYYFTFESSADEGMYDAINKGMDTTDGEIISYLNCDEQYLPNTLSFVNSFFNEHPECDILFGSTLLIRPDGTLIAFRKAYPPHRVYILTDHLYLLSCGMFFRRKIVDDGIEFNASLRYSGDADFVVRVLKARYNAAFTQRYLATFAMTGENMSIEEKAKREGKALFTRAPLWAKMLKPLLTITRRAEKFVYGAYFQKTPFSYSIYVGNELHRQSLIAQRASFRWKKQ